MDREVVFTVDWLNVRFPFDCDARNKQTEKAVIKQFKNKKTLQLVDIGSGSGNNCKYLFERFQQDQSWTLIEHDIRLCKAAISLLADYARTQGYDVSQNDTQVRLIKGKQTIQIEAKKANLLELDKVINLEETDLVTASAVFDLFSLEQYQGLVNKLFANKTAFFAVLNYTGMSFSPKRKHDQEMVGLYESHMLRPQEFGQGMGPNCGKEMLNYLQEINSEAASGASVWKIKPGATDMQKQLLGFMEEAIPELNLNKDQEGNFKEWLAEKQQMIAKNILTIKVQHLDLFGAK